MNIPNILKLASHIETLPHLSHDAYLEIKFPVQNPIFSMLHFTTVCGAPLCTGGWAAYFAQQESDIYAGLSITKTAAVWLGLSNPGSLFEPVLSISYTDVTPHQAAAALRGLAAHGEESFNFNNYIQD